MVICSRDLVNEKQGMKQMATYFPTTKAPVYEAVSQAASEYEHEAALYHSGFLTAEEEEDQAFANTENEAALPGWMIY